jgi:hypothetical protein
MPVVSSGEPLILVVGNGERDILFVKIGVGFGDLFVGFRILDFKEPKFFKKKQSAGGDQHQQGKNTDDIKIKTS